MSVEAKDSSQELEKLSSGSCIDATGSPLQTHCFDMKQQWRGVEVGVLLTLHISIHRKITLEKCSGVHVIKHSVYSGGQLYTTKQRELVHPLVAKV